MAGLNSLERRLASYKSEVESWKALHDEVMDHYKIADALSEAASFGIFIYDRLRAANATTFEEALSLYHSYLAWHQQSIFLLREIEDSERMEFQVSSAEELRKRFAEVNSLVERFKGRITALNAFIKGDGIPADEFLANLRSYPSS